MDPKRAVKLDRTVGRWVYPAHRAVYRLTGGLIGHRSGTGPILLLTTTGRRTGRARTNPLLYMQEGQDFVVVASNGGRDEAPAWSLNLKDQPSAVVQVGRSKMRVLAEILGPGDKEALWPKLTAFYKGWGYYQQLTDRQLPVVRLRRSPR
ncbi:MAG: nitroreductase/quinone reductase family protein [Acidimicrobiales bacterium]